MNLSFLSEAHLRKGDLDEAMMYAQELDELTRGDSLGRQRLMAVERLAETYAAMGQFEPAYIYHLDILKIKEHLLKQEQRSEIIKLEAAYRAEQRENEIRLAQQEVALLSEKNKAATNRSYALASAIVMLVVFGVAMVNRHRRKNAIQEAQLKLKEAENSLLTAEVMHKNRELTTAALHLAQRNELLAKFKEKWKQTADKNDLKGESKRAMKSLKIDEQMNRNIEEFSELFVQTNPEFYQSLATQNNELTKSELRLAALIRMNLDSKQIASLLSISDAAIKKGRYRLRKKLRLESEENLDAYIMRI
jgi:DNA-binding CsgD family transcriptional regulator